MNANAIAKIVSILNGLFEMNGNETTEQSIAVIQEVARVVENEYTRRDFKVYAVLDEILSDPHKWVKKHSVCGCCGTKMKTTRRCEGLCGLLTCDDCLSEGGGCMLCCQEDDDSLCPCCGENDSECEAEGGYTAQCR